MNILPSWLKTLLHLLFVSIVNPFILGINFIIFWGTLAENVGTNVSKLPSWSIPIWILIGIILAAGLTFIQYQVARIIAKVSYAEFRRIDLIAQLPYVLFVFFWLLFMTGEIEGNIMGFVYFPAYLILTLISVPLSFILSVVLIWRAKKKMETD